MPISEILVFISGALITLYFGFLELLKEKRNWIKISILLILFCTMLGSGLYNILEKDQTETIRTKSIIDTTVNTGSRTKEEINDVIDSTKRALLDSIRGVNDNVTATGDSLRRAITEKEKEVKRAFIDLI